MTTIIIVDQYNRLITNVSICRRDGLRIEYEKMKYDLGLSKKTKQVDVLRKAISELQVRFTGIDTISVSNFNTMTMLVWLLR